MLGSLPASRFVPTANPLDMIDNSAIPPATPVALDLIDNSAIPPADPPADPPAMPLSQELVNGTKDGKRKKEKVDDENSDKPKKARPIRGEKKRGESSLPIELPYGFR